MTSAGHSTFSIVDPDKNYRLCDQLDVIIEARDEKMRRKRMGEDYFRARIYNNGLKAGASSDGPVRYIGDGRYKVESYSLYIMMHTLEWGQRVVDARVNFKNSGLYPRGEAECMGFRLFPKL